jgi:hypothetical protein
MLILIQKLILILFCFGVITNCIQKKSPPASVFAGALVNTVQTVINPGAPKSIGLDLVVNRREWNRGCEMRVGNLISDAYAWGGNADIGMMNGGNIRDDQNISIIPKGTVPDEALFPRFIIFKNKVQVVRMNAYRLKQALENAFRQVNTTLVSTSADDVDADGPQHGDCYGFGSGSGRFMQLSSAIQVEIKLTNAPLTLVSGTSSSNNNLKSNNNGSRIVRIIIKGLIIYNNPNGNYDSGWSRGSESCTVRQTSFSNSAACNFYTVAVPDFQVTGGDGIFSFNPSVTVAGASPTEFEGDSPMSAQMINPDLGIDTDLIYNYIQSFTIGPVFPRVSSRILFAN